MPPPSPPRRTAELLRDARRLLPYGNLDSILQRPLLWDDAATFPHFAAAARGCELTDLEGRAYVDWVFAGGPALLGYRHPAVEEAIVEQLACGPTLSLMHPLEIEVARTITELVPCAEMVAFGKNGSDALTGALRIARARTGREVILHYGMHGFHDWFVCTNPAVRGTPESLRERIHPFPYDDLDALERLLRRYKKRVAAVVMEPVRERLPSPGYMQGVRELVTRAGALLVFDEVVTAFRLGLGGGQAFVGVEPDLACLGKSLANGMPLSALVGPRRTMETAREVAFGMTFRGETLSLAAARATLRTLASERVPERVAAIGERVRAAFQASAARHGVRCRLSGPPARMTVGFEDQGGLAHPELNALFAQQCLERGVFCNGNVLPCAQHDDAAIERSLAAFDGALRVVGEAVAGNGRGERGAPAARTAIGFLEARQDAGEVLHLAGWLLLGRGAADAIVFALPDGQRLRAEPVERPDVAQAHPRAENARRCGFAVNVPKSALEGQTERAVTLEALRGERVAFLARIWLEGAPWTGPQWLGDGAVLA